MTWRFEYAASANLPRLFWLAEVADDVVRVRCGSGVRIEEGGFFEGTWSGQSELASAASAHTVFGSGIVASGTELIVITPSHLLEPVIHTRDERGTLLLSNSLVATLVATGRELSADVRYPPVFGVLNRGITDATIQVPTATQPVTLQHFFNLVIASDGSLSLRAKATYPAFADYADYRDFLIENTRSSFANARGYEPVVAMSSGYDSTASGAVAAQAGCRHVVNFRKGWAWAGYTGDDDTPDVAAEALGMEVESYDRLTYLGCDDAPEAEFLATGGTGEDAVYRSMDTALSDRVMVTGYWGGAAWRGHARQGLRRIDLSGSSLGEFRMRVGMIHLPLPYIGGLQQPGMSVIRSSAEMKDWAVGGEYDEPIARRLAEEAGVPRASFGQEKMAVSQRIHAFGLDAMSASGRKSFEAFAGPEALAKLPRKDVVRRRHRFLIKAAAKLHVDPLAAGLRERVRRAVHHEPVLGSLLFRWAVEETRPRYAELAPAETVSER